MAVEVQQPGKDKEQPKDKGKDKDKDKDKKIPEKKLTDVFAESFFPRAELPTGFNPHMLGDLQGYFSRVRVNVVGTQTVTTTTVINTVPNGTPGQTTQRTTTTTIPVTETRTILIPNPCLGAFKVAENASPMPVDRVFFTYNYFGDLRGPRQSADPTITQTTVQTPFNNQIAFGSVTTTTSTVIPGVPQSTANLHREVFGFEKTFFNGRASVELRVPFVQQTSADDQFRASHISALTIITKYAFLLDQETGNVLSGGLGITAPTCSIETLDGAFSSTLLQPWFGYVVNRDRFYVQGFHSIIIPTDSRDVTMLFNDIGLNYWLYRGDPDARLNFIVPMIEAHLTTPLNNRSDDAAVFVPDMLVFTGGAHFGLFRNGVLSLGAATPITGPRPFNIEAFVQLNWRF
jgi:hypothetical protein